MLQEAHHSLGGPQGRALEENGSELLTSLVIISHLLRSEVYASAQTLAGLLREIRLGTADAFFQ